MPDLTLADLLGEEPEPSRRVLCGRPLPSWTDLLAAAKIPEPPGRAEALAFKNANQ